MLCSECGGDRFIRTDTIIACLNCKVMANIENLEGELPDELKKIPEMDQDSIHIITEAGIGSEDGKNILIALPHEHLIMDPVFALKFAAKLYSDAKSILNSEKLNPPPEDPEPNEPITV